MKEKLRPPPVPLLTAEKDERRSGVELCKMFITDRILDNIRGKCRGTLTGSAINIQLLHYWFM